MPSGDIHLRGPVLVPGGAGYIGSHFVRRLEQREVPVVVLDNLSTGHRTSVRVPFEDVDLGDRAALERVFTRHSPVAVVHFAAKCYVGESVSEPSKYYRENVIHTWNLLEAMRAANCRDIVFSSTCATYGQPREVPIPSNHPQDPINPYGRTKLHMEHMLQDFGRAYGLRWAALRYFNAAGALPKRAWARTTIPRRTSSRSCSASRWGSATRSRSSAATGPRATARACVTTSTWTTSPTRTCARWQRCNEGASRWPATWARARATR
jgi:UDP-glucose 4-epimerase